MNSTHNEEIEKIEDSDESESEAEEQMNEVPEDEKKSNSIDESKSSQSSTYNPRKRMEKDGEKEIKERQSKVNEEEKKVFDWNKKSKKLYNIIKEDNIEIDSSIASFYSKWNLDINDLRSILTKATSDGKSNKGLIGIKNLGNSCYINTILQCLFQCYDLLYYVLTSKYEDDINQKSQFKGQIAINLFKIIENVWTKQNTSLNLSSFRLNIQSLSSQFASNNQQDPHEFYLLLLEALRADLSKNFIKSILYSQPKLDDETELFASKRFWTDFKMTNSSIITDLFYGQLKNMLICPECSCKTITYEPFSSISLSIPKLYIVSMIYISSKIESPFIKFDVSISEKAMFFDIDLYINPIIKSSSKKFRCLLSNSSNQRLIKSSENIVSLSNKGIIIICEINEKFFDNDNDDEENIDYYPLIASFRSEKSNEDEGYKLKYLSFSRILPINPYQSINELKLSIFEMLYGVLMKHDYYSKIISEVKFSIKNQLKKEDVILEDIYRFMVEKNIPFPYRVYLTNENMINNTKPGTENAGLIERIYLSLSYENEKEKILNCLNLKSSMMRDNKTCEDLINILRNTMKFHIEIIENEYSSEFNSLINSVISISSTFNNQSSPSPSLQDCLINFQLMEKFDKENEVFCFECSKYQSMFKKLTLFYMPNNLVITFKRFYTDQIAVLKGKSKTYIKDETLVRFPIDKFSIDSYIPSSYELYGVCQHSGSIQGGHYYSVIKNMGKWVGVDDLSIFPCDDEESIVIAEAYMLFFRKK